MDVHMESPPVGVPAPVYPSAPMSPDYELPELLLTIPSGVVLYYIDKVGKAVTTLPAPTFLQIFRSPEYNELGPDDHPAAYLVVRNGEWFYPLIPRKSPVFLSKSGIYTFPNPEIGDGRHSVAIVFGSEVSEANNKMFKDVVEECGLLRREGEGGSGGGGAKFDDPAQRSMTETAVLKGAELIGKGIVIGAKAAEYGMQKGAEAAQRYLGEPEHGKKIDPKIVKGVALAKKGTAATKYATGKVEGWVSDATRALGKSLAHLVFGKSDSSSSSKPSSGTMQQIKWILKLGLQGMGVVFSSLDEAKELLKASLKKETVKVADYKYGPEAALVAGEASDAFGNLVDTADSAMGIGFSKKAFAKKMVKKTGKEMAKEAVSGAKNESNEVRVATDADGRYVLCNAPESAPRALGNAAKESGFAPGSPERSRSPLPSASSATAKREAPPRPKTLPATAPPMPTQPDVVRQRHHQYTDDEVDALLALAPTPTHDAVHHALDLPGEQRQDPSSSTYVPSDRQLYPKL